MFAIAIWEILILFFLGLVSVPMPLSVPPLPEDQKLLQAAPADTVACFSWFGRATANPQSPNLTERLAAEPQVRQLILAVGKALRQAWELEARSDAKLAVECFNLLVTLAERPGCVFLSGVDLPPKPFSVRIGLVAHLGLRAALLAPSLRKLETFCVEQVLGGNGTARSFEPLPGLRFRGLPTPDGVPPLTWGVVDGYLVVALGEGMAAQIARGLRGGDGGMTRHALFKEVQGKVRVARPCFRSFIDLRKVVAMATEAGGNEVARILQLLGLTDLQAILSETGLEGEGFVARSMLATQTRTGLLKLVGGPPLAPAELAIIPGDATLAGAVRIDPRRVHARLLELLGAIDPRATREFQREVVDALQQATGLDLEKDLLAHLGDAVTLWNSPAQGGLLFTGLTVGLELDDAPAFRKSFATAMGSLQEMMPKKATGSYGRVRRGFYIETMSARDSKIYFLNTIGEEMPFAPAWCVTDTHLLVSMFPQMLKASLARGLRAEDSLASHPRVKAAPAAVAMMLFDVPRMFESLYPALHLLAQLAASELQREGVDVHIGALPIAGAIRPHTSTETSVLEVRPDGLLLTRKGTIPVLDPFLGFAAPLAGALPMLLLQNRAVRAMRIERARAERAQQEALRRQREGAKKAAKDKQDAKGKPDAKDKQDAKDKPDAKDKQDAKDKPDAKGK